MFISQSYLRPSVSNYIVKHVLKFNFIIEQANEIYHILKRFTNFLMKFISMQVHCKSFI